MKLGSLYGTASFYAFKISMFGFIRHSADLGVGSILIRNLMRVTLAIACRRNLDGQSKSIILQFQAHHDRSLALPLHSISIGR